MTADIHPELYDVREHVDLSSRGLDWDFDPEPVEAPCDWCGGPPVLLGVLGRRIHFRCRDCGIPYSREEIAL